MSAPAPVESGRPPSGFRLSRLFRALATLALVAIVIFTVTAAYSASEFRQAPGESRFISSQLLPNETLLLDAAYNVSNVGFYPVNGIQVIAHVYLPQGGGLLARGGSPMESLGAGARLSIPISFYVPLNLTGPAAALLTKDAQLPTYTWANATYASVFPIEVAAETNLSWGAPFAGLSVSVGAPAIQPNGTITDLVTVAFANHAPFAELGTLHFAIVDAAGQVCGANQLDVNVVTGGNFDRSVVVTLSAGCNPARGQVTLSFTGSGFSLPLPTVQLP